jgi:hypothetical protein
MTAGIQPSQAGLNATAGNIVINARNALQQILFFNDYINNLGQAGLVALGFTTDDANLMLAVFGNMSAISNTCLGEPYTGPSLPFNFLAQTIPLWGGQ